MKRVFEFIEALGFASILGVATGVFITLLFFVWLVTRKEIEK